MGKKYLGGNKYEFSGEKLKNIKAKGTHSFNWIKWRFSYAQF